MSKNNTSFGQRLSRFIVVISAVGLGLSLWSQGIMDDKSFTVLLILSVIAAAIDSTWARLIFAIASLGFILLIISGYNIPVFKQNASYVGLLIIILFGFYFMIGGMRKK